jgi:hypothetical protein
MDLVEPPEPLPTPLELGPQGNYRVVPAANAARMVMPGRAAPTRIRFYLEGGYELDIVVTQATIDNLYQALESFRTGPVLPRPR